MSVCAALSFRPFRRRRCSIATLPRQTGKCSLCFLTPSHLVFGVADSLSSAPALWMISGVPWLLATMTHKRFATIHNSCSTLMQCKPSRTSGVHAACMHSGAQCPCQALLKTVDCGNAQSACAICGAERRERHGAGIGGGRGRAPGRAEPGLYHASAAQAPHAAPFRHGPVSRLQAA